MPTPKQYDHLNRLQFTDSRAAEHAWGYRYR